MPTRAAQTANTIGRPVRSRHSAPRSWCGAGSSNADRSASSPIISRASAVSPSARISAVGNSVRTSTTDDADWPVTEIDRTAGSGTSVTSCTDSTAPSEPTQSEGSSTYSEWLRAYSTLDTFATSTSPARSSAFSVVGTPTTSSARPSPRCRARLHASGKVLM